MKIETEDLIKLVKLLEEARQAYTADREDYCWPDQAIVLLRYALTKLREQQGIPCIRTNEIETFIFPNGQS